MKYPMYWLSIVLVLCMSCHPNEKMLRLAGHSVEVDSTYEQSQLTYLNGDESMLIVHPEYVIHKGMPVPYKFDSISSNASEVEGMSMLSVKVPGGLIYGMEPVKGVFLRVDPGGLLLLDAKPGVNRKGELRMMGTAWCKVESGHGLYNLILGGVLNISADSGEFVMAAMESGVLNVISFSAVLNCVYDHKSYKIKKGEALVVTRTKVQVTDAVVSSSAKGRWNRGERSFFDVTVDDVLRSMCNWHAVTLVSQLSEGLPISGIFILKDSIPIQCTRLNRVQRFDWFLTACRDTLVAKAMH